MKFKFVKNCIYNKYVHTKKAVITYALITNNL